MNQTSTHVEDILGENTSSLMTGVSPRDSDTELYIQYLQRILEVDLTAAQLTLIRTIKYESLSRCRRRLQQKGKYHGSPEVMRRRRIKGYEIQQVAPKETADGLANRLEKDFT